MCRSSYKPKLSPTGRAPYESGCAGNGACRQRQTSVRTREQSHSQVPWRTFDRLTAQPLDLVRARVRRTSRKVHGKRLTTSTRGFPEYAQAGPHINHARKAIDRIVERSKVEVRGHDRRRTAASLMVGANVPRLVVSKILNHVNGVSLLCTSDTATTARASGARLLGPTRSGKAFRSACRTHVAGRR